MKKYQNQFRRYFTELAADTPSPGGGSVGAVCFCMGASLIEMSLRISNREKEEEVRRFIKLLEKSREKVSRYIDEDGEVFNKIISVKDKKRRKVMYKHLERVTFKLGDESVKVFEGAVSFRGRIKKSLEGDFALGMELLKIALKVSIKNMESNQKMFGVKSQEKLLHLKKSFAKLKKR